MPVVVSYIQERLQPAPAGTFSICIVPERLNGMSDVEDLNRRDPRALSNVLSALYYMVKTPAINGIILSDNIRLERQGHKDYLRIDQYLQDVLMPVFLAAQSRYIFRTQLDPANVVLTMAPRGEGKQEFVAACFAICPLNEPDERMLSMEKQTVAADPVTHAPDLEAMLETALANPTIECETSTARSVLAVLSGPPEALERMVPDLDAGFRFERTIWERCVEEHPTDSPVGQGFARFFLAAFPNMTDVRLTLLLAPPGFRSLRKPCGQP